MNNLNFRAWHKEDKKMCSVASILIKAQLVVFEHDYEKIINSRCEHIQDLHTKLDEVILRQSTGLKDCKGVDIFEGDLLLIKSKFEDNDEHSSGIFEVKLKESLYGGFYFGLDFVKGFDSIYCVGSSDYWIINWVLKWNNIKIIGNIYENSDIFRGGV